MDRDGCLKIIKTLENPSNIPNSYNDYVKYVDIMSNRDIESGYPLIEEYILSLTLLQDFTTKLDDCTSLDGLSRDQCNDLIDKVHELNIGMKNTEDYNGDLPAKLLPITQSFFANFPDNSNNSTNINNNSTSINNDSKNIGFNNLCSKCSGQIGNNETNVTSKHNIQNNNCSSRGGSGTNDIPDSGKRSNPFGFVTAKRQLLVNQKDSRYNDTNDDQPVNKSSGRHLLSSYNPDNKSRNQPNNLSNNNTNNTEINGKNVDSKMYEMILNEIVYSGKPVYWTDIVGLESAKKCVEELVIWPLQRPDIFTGLLRTPKGILLFGPPGTGKTLIGKAIAYESGATFFSISASSLTSKWVGEAEKMVRTLFQVAHDKQPAVVFIDEIDSLLSHRNDNEQESTRRIKTEFLVQLDGVATEEDDKVLMIGATNRPQDLDEAARRRFVKRFYIPLPDFKGRKDLFSLLLKNNASTLSDADITELANKTDGYSGADIRELCTEAAMGPIRDCSAKLESMSIGEIRPINYDDFVGGLSRVRASVSDKDLEGYIEWNKLYGCLS